MRHVTKGLDVCRLHSAVRVSIDSAAPLLLATVANQSMQRQLTGSDPPQQLASTIKVRFEVKIGSSVRSEISLKKV